MKIKRLSLIFFIVIFQMTLAACSPSDAGNGGGDAKFDATKLPFYVENTSDMQYSYTDEERIRPFWMGNVMYNEQLMVVEKDGKTEGKLLYEPQKIISVRDWTLDVEYAEGVDYLFNGGTITLPQGSAIPIFKDEWSRGINIPAAYPNTGAGTGYEMIGNVMYTETSLIYGNYIHVTYVYDPADVDRTKVKKHDADELVGLSDMLEAKKDIKMAVLGDNVAEGSSSSGKWNHKPFCPPFPDLVEYGIETLGGVNVELVNLSVGGKDSTWGAGDEQLDRVMALVPDLLIVRFGVNDSLSNLEGNRYKNNIKKIIEAARIANDNCQIILLAGFPSHPEIKSASLHEKICGALKSIADDPAYLDIAYVSLYETGLEMLKNKQYYEIAGNNANHPNDFLTRCYAMNILSAIFDYDKL